MNTIRYELDADGIATITFDAPDSPVNTMTAEWQADLAEAAAQLGRDKERIKGVLLASAKTTFFAGAALKSRADADRAPDAAPGFARDRGDEGELSRASRRSAGRSSRCSTARRSAAAGRSR